MNILQEKVNLNKSVIMVCKKRERKRSDVQIKILTSLVSCFLLLCLPPWPVCTLPVSALGLLLPVCTEDTFLFLTAP